jgi:hypothetical protein
MDRTLKYYLAGPMTNRPQFNYPLFFSVAGRLRGWGLDIHSPAELDSPEIVEMALASETGSSDDYGNMQDNGKIKDTWGDFLSRDVKLIADSLNGIILLPEWETSKGARLEAFVSLICEYPAYYYIDGVCVEATYEDIMEKINDSIIR